LVSIMPTAIDIVESPLRISGITVTNL